MRVLEVANNQQDPIVQSLSIPQLSIGFYSFPLDDYAEIVLLTIESWFKTQGPNTNLKEVKIICNSKENKDEIRAFEKKLNEIYATPEGWLPEKL